MQNNFKEKLDAFLRQFSALSLEEKEYIFNELENDLNNTNFSSINCLKVYKGQLKLLKKNSGSLQNSKVLEIGSGKYSLLTGLLWLLQGAHKYYGVDKYCDPFNAKFWWDLYREKLRKEFAYSENEKIKNFILESNWNSINESVNIFKDDFINIKFPDNHFDFVYSNAVMEHVDKPEKVVKELYRVLKSNGISYHGIDLRPHHGDRETPATILKYSMEEWNIIKKNKSYLNRLRNSDWIKLFTETGFEIIEVNNNYFENITKELYKQISHEFDSYNLEDLSIKQCNILVRKL